MKTIYVDLNVLVNKNTSRNEVSCTLNRWSVYHLSYLAKMTKSEVIPLVPDGVSYEIIQEFTEILHNMDVSFDTAYLYSGDNLEEALMFALPNGLEDFVLIASGEELQSVWLNNHAIRVENGSLDFAFALAQVLRMSNWQGSVALASN